MDYFNYGIDDFIPCEVCERRGVDIHHLENRKSGGDPKGNKDLIENLQALCRECHIKYGDVPDQKQFLIEIHYKKLCAMNNVGKPFDIKFNNPKK